MKKALLSVTDKTGIVEFAAGLIELGFEILSTGGTAAELRKNNIHLTDVAEFTQSPEIMGGRVKTLHPMIHAGILANRSNLDHMQDLEQIGSEKIDLVCVNLYNFAAHQDKNLSEAIEHIDVGGPTMLRAAAKNFEYVIVVPSPEHYSSILDELKLTGNCSLTTRQKLAGEVFAHCAQCDGAIASRFAKKESPLKESADAPAWAEKVSISLELITPLRYGENPQQKAALYKRTDDLSFAPLYQSLQGKELSYNNLLDIDAAVNILSSWQGSKCSAVCIIKHNNPCGVAISETINHSWEKALRCDPQSAFGGIVGCNSVVDATCAQAMSKVFLEVIVAPAFTPEAIEIFATKKNLRLVLCPSFNSSAGLVFRPVRGGMLVQDIDPGPAPTKEWKFYSPTDSLVIEDLEFANIVALHVKSNAIVLAKGRATIGIGAGQMSRIDAAKLSAQKAKNAGIDCAGSVLASDAFFPFADIVEFAHEIGVSAIVQSGGSMRDQESIDACKKYGIALAFSGRRHFKH